jgi:RNA polymerase sigma-70 factor (ECF subfamily)
MDLRDGVRELPLRQRQAVILYYLADLSVTDVAHAMGTTQGAAKSHLSRARAALRNYLDAKDMPSTNDL